MNKLSIVVALSITLTSQCQVTPKTTSAMIQDHEAEEWKPDRAMFEGRIVGVHFEADREDLNDPLVSPRNIQLKLQFIIDKHYATRGLILPRRFETSDEKPKRNKLLASLDVDVIPNLQSITRDGYEDELNRIIPGEVRLGQPCLVIGDHDAIYGKGTLISLEPATEAARNAFLDKHADYIVRFRRFAQSRTFEARLGGHRTRIGIPLSRLSMILEFESFDKPIHDPRLHASFEDTLKRGYQHYLDLKAAMASKKQELEQLVEKTANSLHKQTYLAMIDDLKAFERRLQEMRNQELDIRKKAPQYQDIILRTNPDVQLSEDPP